jgi:hypothetical protein
MLSTYFPRERLLASQRWERRRLEANLEECYLYLGFDRRLRRHQLNCVAQDATPKIVHDSEYYILETQHSEQWAATD